MVDGADASRVIKDLNLRGTDLSTALKDWGGAVAQLPWIPLQPTPVHRVDFWSYSTIMHDPPIPPEDPPIPRAAAATEPENNNNVDRELLQLGGDGRTNGMEVDEAKGKETKTTDDTIITPDGKAVLGHDALRMRLRRLVEVKPSGKCYVDQEIRDDYANMERREWKDIASIVAFCSKFPNTLVRNWKYDNSVLEYFVEDECSSLIKRSEMTRETHITELEVGFPIYSCLHAHL
ncbi:Uncharacterized protein SCF082_LOCUS24030 [Durusdinium trenchii]|uniref:Uncharacterized protein n=1 Tax=Durusdinium trenchii TaxID=1381693 RepID=A0ABP0LR42_9DINO